MDVMLSGGDVHIFEHMSQFSPVFVPPSTRLVQIPDGFSQAVQPMVSAAGAMGSIATGLSDLTTISFDQLDNVPEFVGPLIDIGAESSAAELSIEQLLAPDFYERLHGSGFEAQRQFVQGLLSRALPDQDLIHELYLKCVACREAVSDLGTLAQHMKGEDRAMASCRLEMLAAAYYFDGDFLQTQKATVEFLRGLAFSDAETEIPDAKYLLMTSAARSFSNANLDGAAAISHRIGMLCSPEHAASQVEMRCIINYLGSSMMSGRNASPLGEAYLYALYYSKEAGDFDRMQGLFLHSGKVHNARGLVGEALRAYMASLWAFLQSESKTVRMRDGAIAALKMIGRLKPQHESRVSQLAGDLQDAETVSDIDYYIDKAMQFEHAGRAIANGKPKLDDLYSGN